MPVLPPRMGKDRQVPGAQLPDSYRNKQIPDSIRDPVSKPKIFSINFCPLHTHEQANVHESAYVHIHTKINIFQDS